ncbi:hypothetical protein SARC_14041, partial [Sphaeroforma arctica JP610]
MRAQMIGQHMMSNQDMLYAGVRYSGSNGLGTTPATPPVSSILHDDRCSGLPHDVITGVDYSLSTGKGANDVSDLCGINTATHEADSLRGGETTRTVP